VVMVTSETESVLLASVVQHSDGVVPQVITVLVVDLKMRLLLAEEVTEEMASVPTTSAVHLMVGVVPLLTIVINWCKLFHQV